MSATRRAPVPQHGNSGSISTVFALCVTAIAVALGCAVDLGRASIAKVKLQDNLDSAVMAGALSMSQDQVATATRTFEHIAGGTPGQKIISASFTPAPNNRVQGRVEAQIPTSFMRVLGVDAMTVGASSVAEGETPVTSGHVCVLALDRSASPGLLVNSGANVQGAGCQLDVNSTGSPAATFNAGSALAVNKTCVAGSSIIDNGGSHPNLQLGCTTVSDPFAGSLPVPSSASCDFSSQSYNVGPVNLTPGVYCGGFNFNPGVDVNFAPGLYVIKGGNWNIDGGVWAGSGVTIHFADSSAFQFNNGVAGGITAPTSGAYAGIALFEPTGLAVSPFVFDDSQGMAINGLIYLPSRDVTFNHGSGVVDKQMTMVVNTLILDQTHWNLSPAPLSIPAITAAPQSARLVK